MKDGRSDRGDIGRPEGNIWIHAPDGLNQFWPKRFLVPAPKLDLHDFFYTLAPDRAGRIWGAEPNSGKLSRLGLDSVAIPEPGAPLHLVASGRDGTRLKADKRSVARVIGDTEETFPLPPGRDGKPADRELWGLLDDGRRIWTAASDTEAVAWSDGQWRTRAEFGLPNQIDLLKKSWKLINVSFLAQFNLATGGAP